MKKFVYSFDEGSKDMKDLLGGKGANLAEMTKINLPVPFGFTVSTEACSEYYEQGEKISDEIIEQIFEKLALLEEKSGKKFGEVVISPETITRPVVQSTSQAEPFLMVLLHHMLMQVYTLLLLF